MKYTKELSFFNLYLQKEDTVTLEWDFPDGFADVALAKTAVADLMQDPEWFVYIRHHNQIYAVAAASLENTVVVSSRYVWFRDTISKRIIRTLRESCQKLPYTIHSCNAVDYYKNTLCQDVFSFDPEVRITSGKRVKDFGNEYKDFCVATLGSVTNQTMIPVYQLGCMELYFKNANTLLELWQRGIKSYNPFTGHSETAPYTLQSYLTDREKTPEEIKNLTSMRDYFLNQGVFSNIHSNDTIEVPIFMAKELLLLLNGALSDMGEEKSFLIRNRELQQKIKNVEEGFDTTDASPKSYHICRICHITLPDTYTDAICPMCKETELFMEVKNFIREHDVNENDVAEHFNIPINQVRGWIKEGRISYKEMKGIHSTDKSKEPRICRECGMLLPATCKDNICKNCASLAEATRQRAKAKLAVMSNLNTQDTTMHYGKKR